MVAAAEQARGSLSASSLDWSAACGCAEVSSLRTVTESLSVRLRALAASSLLAERPSPFVTVSP